MSRVHCWQCTMSFTVAEPHPKCTNATERCPERGCNKPFWHSTAKPNNPTLVGVRPENAGMFETEARFRTQSQS